MAAHGATCVLVGGGVDASRHAGGATSRRPPARGRTSSTSPGATTLRTLAGVLALARVCVSNDSGAMHVAAALGARVVALFGPTRDKETAPLGACGARPATVLIHDVWCRPCMLRECPIDHRCMTGLEPARVLAAVVDAAERSGMSAARPAVFLDRDGTLSEERGFIDRLELLEIFPWTPDAIRLLNRAGFAVVVVTNQSAIGRGIIDVPFLQTVHDAIDRHLADGPARKVDRYYFCPHHPDAPSCPSTAWCAGAASRARA